MLPHDLERGVQGDGIAEGKQGGSHVDPQCLHYVRAGRSDAGRYDLGEEGVCVGEQHGRVEESTCKAVVSDGINRRDRGNEDAGLGFLGGAFAVERLGERFGDVRT